MDASELDGKAWGRNGPLKNCKLCRTFADAIVTATLYTPPEEAKCFLGEIVQAVIREGNDCIMEKNPDFPGLPASPIIEKPMHKDIEDLIDDISNFIIVHSRIQKCANEDPEAANTTTKCIEKPFPGFLEKHKSCSHFIHIDHFATELLYNEMRVMGLTDDFDRLISLRLKGTQTVNCAERYGWLRLSLKHRLPWLTVSNKSPSQSVEMMLISLLRDCVQAIPNKCRKELNVLKDAICLCVQDARAEVRRRFERLTQSFHLAVQSRVDREKAIGKGGQIESCVEKIRSFMKTNANDWYEVVDSATSKCLKSNPMRRSVGIKPLLHVGCKKVENLFGIFQAFQKEHAIKISTMFQILHDKTGIYMKQLSEAFDFVGYLIDAITNRSSRICNIDQ
ncbi:unnamed protein product [Anisakis simplex]|uniref:Saposin B-type domain-containing protein n=1 Tax=Anisakis simplex TaxID=6269 RepID=A0A0M3K721_ANISI|nr:unnamed protein product [Anisakis simplex]